MRNDDKTPIDAEVDASVREAYRRLATETTPRHLDETVLAEAASATKPAGRGLWLWRRPLAWVTMIGLSFAIVLEFSQTGTEMAPVPLDVVPESAPAVAPASTAPAADYSAPVEAKEATVVETPPQSAPEPARRKSADARADRTAEESLLESVATGTEPEKRSRDEELEVMSAPAAARLGKSEPGAEAEAERPAPSSALVDSFAARELGDAAQASGQRLQADADRQVEAYGFSAQDEEPACDEEARADAERWRECIDALFSADRLDEATVELRLYREAFPNEAQPAKAK